MSRMTENGAVAYNKELDMLSIHKAEKGELPRVGSHPGLHDKFQGSLSYRVKSFSTKQINNTNNNKKQAK